MFGGIQGRFRELKMDGVYGAFEKDCLELFSERLSSYEFCCLLWGALANIVWKHEKHGEIDYSFRAAGDLIAALRKEGDYMRWYCSSRDGYVPAEIAIALKTRGWNWEPA